MGFRPPSSLRTHCAPTWNDTSTGFPGECVRPFRERVIQGEVSDGNAYASGGISGHAGVFATAGDVMRLVLMILYPSNATVLGIDAEVARRFTTVHDVNMSSRALGWDTNNYVANTYRGCGNLSSETFTHTGYTGTQICADPIHSLATVLFTNRVYPNADEESETKIHAYRKEFNNAALKVFS